MLDKEFYNETYDMFIKANGKDYQMRMCIEEMSELTKALCKYMRIDLSTADSDILKLAEQNIIEECADVIICAGQIKRMFGEAAVNKVMDEKIQRGRKIVENHIVKKQNKK